uniref:Uncharacterized protein n=1 Tax=Anguilla anguilla TaxID=7936 RepID=A0A0E9WX88_ANGAN
MHQSGRPVSLLPHTQPFPVIQLWVGPDPMDAISRPDVALKASYHMSKQLGKKLSSWLSVNS